MEKNTVSTLERGLLILELVKSQSGITLKEVMEKQDISKSTAFRILTTLEDMDYIYKIRTKYYFNPKHFMDMSQSDSLREWTSLNAIYQLAEDMQLSMYLGKVDGTDLVMTQALHAPFNEPNYEEIGNRTQLHQTALGKVILAHYDDERSKSLLNQLSLEPVTHNTFQDPQLFHYHLKAINEDGYAFDDEELNIGLRCVAVPVFRDNEVIAALAISGSVEEIARGRVKEIANKLHEGSVALTKEIETLGNIH